MQLLCLVFHQAEVAISDHASPVQIAYITYFHIAITISFTQSMYSVIESAGRIQPVLFIINPSLTDITVEVFTTNVSAFGKY